MTACVSGAYASLDGILVCAAKGTKTIETTTSGRNEEEMRRARADGRQGAAERHRRRGAGSGQFAPEPLRGVDG